MCVVCCALIGCPLLNVTLISHQVAERTATVVHQQTVEGRTDDDDDDGGMSGRKVFLFHHLHMIELQIIEYMRKSFLCRKMNLF